jgi:hypothetical protein
MTTTRIILRTLHAALLATVLTPAPLFAEPVQGARQMLALAQTQSRDQFVSGEVKKITTSGLIPSTAKTAQSTKSSAPQPVVIAAITPVDSPVVAPNPSVSSKVDAATTIVGATGKADAPSIEVTALPAAPQPQVAASLIVVLPAPPAVTTATSAESTTLKEPLASTITTPSTPITPPSAAVSVVQTQPSATELPPAASTSKTSSAASAPLELKGATETGDNAHTIARTVARGPVASGKVAAGQDVSKHARRSYSGDGFRTDGSSFVGPQLQRIISRPEVRSLLAEYGLN